VVAVLAVVVVAAAAVVAVAAAAVVVSVVAKRVNSVSRAYAGFRRGRVNHAAHLPPV
jgi:hypothetical protein